MLCVMKGSMYMPNIYVCVCCCEGLRELRLTELELHCTELVVHAVMLSAGDPRLQPLAGIARNVATTHGTNQLLLLQLVLSGWCFAPTAAAGASVAVHCRRQPGGLTGCHTTLGSSAGSSRRTTADTTAPAAARSASTAANSIKQQQAAAVGGFDASGGSGGGGLLQRLFGVGGDGSGDVSAGSLRLNTGDPAAAVPERQEDPLAWSADRAPANRC